MTEKCHANLNGSGAKHFESTDLEWDQRTKLAPPDHQYFLGAK
jgi:hypothetical protein